MNGCRDQLQAGAPMRLPSGSAVMVIQRTRMIVSDRAGWQCGFVLCEPHALLLQAADGTASILAAGAEPVGWSALSEAVPHWEQLWRALAAAAAE